MVKTANAIKKLKAVGATIEQNGNHYTAFLPAAKLEISDSNGDANYLYVSRKGQNDDIVTDYFPGTFCRTIKGAIELAQHMATW